MFRRSSWDFHKHWQFAESASDLAVLYRQSGEAEREFASLRVYLTDLPYWDNRDNTNLIAESKDFSLANLERLRVVSELTNRKRGRVFSYTRYIGILNEGMQAPDPARA